jgi:hypothetical protein
LFGLPYNTKDEKKGISIQEKNIKLLVEKQLKEELPNRGGFTEKEENRPANQVSEQVLENFCFDKEVSMYLNGLIGIPTLPSGSSHFEEISGIR